MRNRDAPAQPTEVMVDPGGKGRAAQFEPCAGLTKREAAAIAAMQGILSGPHANELNSILEKGDTARSAVVAILAVKHANALFNELEETTLGPHGWPADQCDVCGGKLGYCNGFMDDCPANESPGGTA